jgi:hypothetical protein
MTQQRLKSRKLEIQQLSSQVYITTMYKRYNATNETLCLIGSVKLN